MDTELVARLRAVIPRLARVLNDTSTGEDLTPTQYSVLGPVRVRGPLGLTELTELEGLNPTMLPARPPAGHNGSPPGCRPRPGSAGRGPRVRGPIRPARDPPVPGNPEDFSLPEGSAAYSMRNLRDHGRASGSRKRGSGDGTSSAAPATPPITATHSAGRSPAAEPSSPPSSAPSGRVP